MISAKMLQCKQNRKEGLNRFSMIYRVDALRVDPDNAWGTPGPGIWETPMKNARREAPGIFHIATSGYLPGSFST